MKTPFFNTAPRVALLLAVARSWERTPFVGHAAIKGAGVDCIHLAAEILRECGHLQEYQFPSYTLDGGQHKKRSQLIEWLESDPRFSPVHIMAPIEAGDVLTFRLDEDSVDHHVAVSIGGDRVVSALSRYGVRERTLRERFWREKLTGIYRPMEGTE